MLTSGYDHWTMRPPLSEHCTETIATCEAMPLPKLFALHVHLDAMDRHRRDEARKAGRGR